MLRYRSKCVKSNTLVKHKGYLSDYDQTLRQAQLDFTDEKFLGICCLEAGQDTGPHVSSVATGPYLRRHAKGKSGRVQTRAAGPVHVYSARFDVRLEPRRSETEPRSSWLQ